jgi:hypothetical protein
MMTQAPLQQAFLKSILDYCPETGVWTYKVRRGGIAAGRVAGTPDRDGYNVICLNGRHYRAARLAWFYMTGVWPRDLVDHIDTNKANDAWRNLRPATMSENKGNQRSTVKNRLGVKGVRLNRHSKRLPYVAQININRTRYYLGSFATIEEASSAYAERARMIFGEFARTK